jgi:hypothetical protein
MKQTINIAEDFINQMFIIAGHPEVSYNDVLGRQDAWYTEWTMTEAQRDEWKEWGISYLKKKKRSWSKKLIEREVAMIDLCYGLKIDNNPVK